MTYPEDQEFPVIHQNLCLPSFLAILKSPDIQVSPFHLWIQEFPAIHRDLKKLKILFCFQKTSIKLLLLKFDFIEKKIKSISEIIYIN
jgi:hypothetical protein